MCSDHIGFGFPTWYLRLTITGSPRPMIGHYRDYKLAKIWTKVNDQNPKTPSIVRTPIPISFQKTHSTILLIGFWIGSGIREACMGGGPASPWQKVFFPETNSLHLMVGRWLSFLGPGPFSEAFWLISGRPAPPHISFPPVRTRTCFRSTLRSFHFFMS